MNGWIPKSRQHLFLGLCALAILAATGYGGLKVQRLILETVDGVDIDGNPDAREGAEGPGKSYKNIRRGIIIQINKSEVDNLYGFPRHFKNRGLPILDPQTNDNTTLTTTKDLLVVEQKTTKGAGSPLVWIGTQIKVYDPRFPELTPQAAP